MEQDQDIIRGSTNIPLTDEGRRQSDELGKIIARRGGLDALVSSNLDRARETALRIIQQNPRTKFLGAVSGLRPWHLGVLEGKPTKDVLMVMQDFIQNPQTPVPGEGGTSAGESFDSYRQRFLPFLRGLMSLAEQNRDIKIGAVTHYRGVKLSEAWLKKGAPSTGEIDVPEMMHDGDPPGSIVRIYQDPNRTNGAWRIEKVSPGSDASLLSGVYLIRHGQTAWNKNASSGS